MAGIGDALLAGATAGLATVAPAAASVASIDDARDARDCTSAQGRIAGLEWGIALVTIEGRVLVVARVEFQLIDDGVQPGQVRPAD